MEVDGGGSRGHKRIFALSINEGGANHAMDPGCGDPLVPAGFALGK